VYARAQKTHQVIPTQHVLMFEMKLVLPLLACLCHILCPGL